MENIRIVAGSLIDVKNGSDVKNDSNDRELCLLEVHGVVLRTGVPHWRSVLKSRANAKLFSWDGV